MLNSMDKWCKTQHGRSGLTELVRRSSISVDEAERMVLEFVKRHVEKGEVRVY